ncbi:glyoxal oxidase [Patulibacter americanus]|uniref:glyoxal oxidase n=1 Tax=Patulibacter americanus TaxID=588672 RepID=UPI0004252F20|nr:glyoxal oxidase [Patulibacter americanus]
MRVHVPRPLLSRAVLATSVLALIAPAAVLHDAAPAHAHGAAGHSAGSRAGERALQREERRSIGPQHAAEHASQRAALRRWRARPAAEKARVAARVRRAATRATAAAGPADQVGRWSTERIGMPTWALNAAMLPTGKVAYWGRGALETTWLRTNAAPFYLWDPDTGESKRIDPPQETIDFDGDGQADDVAPAPLFCSGQSLLPSGELYVAGGNAFYPSYGNNRHEEYGGWGGTYSFDPWTETWTTQPDMNHGRWYPTQVLLPDGRIGITSGYDEVGKGADNQEFELFTPAAGRGGVGTMTSSLPAKRETYGFYPHMQILPGGRLGFVGQTEGDTRSLDPADLSRPGAEGSAWDQGPRTASSARVGGSAALLPGTSRMMFLGGYGADWATAPKERPLDPATNTVETTDFAAAQPRWSSGGPGDVPNMNVGRSYGTLVTLPDGGFAYIGGSAGFDRQAGQDNNASGGKQELKSVELWQPGQDRWRVGPAQAKWRGYHSTAVLLPDGRVLSAGDDYWGMGDTPDRGPMDTPNRPADAPKDQGEIYEPAYLFDGAERAPRPTITSGPAAVRWGAAFGLGVDEVPGRKIVRATLIAPTAVTHSVDMNRAFVDLPVIERVPGKGVNLRAPSWSDVAPPGWYMLFAWDETGTPSVARWVQVQGDAPNAPLVGPDWSPPPGPGDGATGTRAPATPAPGPRVRDTAGPRAALALRRPGRRATVLRLRVGADEPGRITVRSKIARERERSATVRLTKSRLSGELRLRLSKSARRTLRAGRVLKVRLRSTARDPSGNVARRTVTVRLRPRGR